jgi:hypothetical protein
MSSEQKLPSPWKEFLTELDAALTEPVSLYCIGGFVVSLCYGLPRPTGDIDCYSVLPHSCVHILEQTAGLGSPLSKKYKVFLHFVQVNTMPEDYEARSVEMFPGRFKRLRLYAPDPYDLILSKMERNSPKDREDVEYLVKAHHLDPQQLRERYEKELRPYLANESRHDLTLKLWLDACFGQQV